MDRIHKSTPSTNNNEILTTSVFTFSEETGIAGPNYGNS